MGKRSIHRMVPYFPLIYVLAGLLSPLRIYGEEKPHIVLFQESSLEVDAVAFSPDGRFALCGEKGNRLLFLDLEAARSLHAFEGELRKKKGDDGLTWKDQKRIEEMKEAIVIGTMTGFDDGEWVVMTPEGYFNASEKGVKHIKVQVGRSTYSINHNESALGDFGAWTRGLYLRLAAGFGG